MATRKRTSAEPKLTEQGMAVFRYDKNRDGTNARFINARPGTVWFDMLSDSPGWYQVDPKERYDAEAAKAAAEGKQEEFEELQALQNSRVGALSSRRGRGKASANEQAALAERDEAREQLDAANTEIEALRAQLAERDAQSTSEGSES